MHFESCILTSIKCLCSYVWNTLFYDCLKCVRILTVKQLEIVSNHRKVFKKNTITYSIINYDISLVPFFNLVMKITYT